MHKKHADELKASSALNPVFIQLKDLITSRSNLVAQMGSISAKEKTHWNNPFDSFVMPRYRDPQKIYLSKELVAAIETATIPDDLLIAHTWFLIDCETALRFQDLKNFNKEKHNNDGRLVITLAKQANR